MMTSRPTSIVGIRQAIRIKLSDEELKRRRARYFKAYYQANADVIKRRALAAYYADREAAGCRTREYALSDPDRTMAYAQAHYKANQARIEQRVRDWNAANPEAARARGRNYRARLYAAEGSHTGDDIKALYVKQKGRCVYCTKALGKSYHVDHKKPLSRGGSNGPKNLQLTCAPCNISKRALDPAEFIRRLTIPPHHRSRHVRAPVACPTGNGRRQA